MFMLYFESNQGGRCRERCYADRVGFLPWQKLFLPGQWKKPVKTVAKTSKNRQNQRHHKLITDFITHILQAVFEPYYNSGTDSEHK